MSRLLKIGLPVAFGGVLAGCWYLALALQWADPLVTPPPHEILLAAFAEADALARAARNTFSAAVRGFGNAALAGLTLAAVFSMRSWARMAAYPWVIFAQMIPVVVLIPILVHQLGPGRPSVVAVTFVLSFFPFVAGAMQGFAAADRKALSVFKLMGANRWQMLVHVRLPAALPHILTGMQIAATLAVIGAVTGEMLAGDASAGANGLGWMVIVYSRDFRIPEMYASALCACLLGFVFVGIARYLHWELLRRWHDSYAHTQE